MTMTVPKELIEFLRNEDDFVIATHFSPDGDALGSSIALSTALRKMGKKTFLLDKDPVPPQYKFLPGHENFQTFEAMGNFRNLIIVDCNDVDRVTSNKELQATLRNHASVVIDHHASEKPFGDIRWVRPDSPATGMMVFRVIKELGIAMTADMAINLYTAIATDTGNFRHENTTPDALAIAAELATAGAKPHEISRELYDSWTEGRLRLFIKVLNTLTIEDDIAMVTVTNKMLEETLTSSDDTETFVEFPRIVKDIGISVLFREIDAANCKISLRSKDGLDVAKVAEAFNGGGHKNAAGCKIKADIETAKQLIREKLKMKTTNQS